MHLKIIIKLNTGLWGENTWFLSLNLFFFPKILGTTSQEITKIVQRGPLYSYLVSPINYISHNHGAMSKPILLFVYHMARCVYHYCSEDVELFCQNKYLTHDTTL